MAFATTWAPGVAVGLDTVQSQRGYVCACVSIGGESERERERAPYHQYPTCRHRPLTSIWQLCHSQEAEGGDKRNFTVARI